MRRLAYIFAAVAFAIPLAAGSAPAALVPPAQSAVTAGAEASPIDKVRYYRHHRHWHHRRVYYRHHRHWRH